MKTYEVETGRKGKWWWIEISGFRGGYSQAKTLREVPDMARDAIAVLLNIAPDSFDVAVTVVGEEADLIKQVEQRDAEVKAAAEAALQSKIKAVHAMTAKSIPARDIATMLNLSPAYVSQLNRRDLDNIKTGDDFVSV